EPTFRFFFATNKNIAGRIRQSNAMKRRVATIPMYPLTPADLKQICDERFADMPGEVTAQLVSLHSTFAKRVDAGLFGEGTGGASVLPRQILEAGRSIQHFLKQNAKTAEDTDLRNHLVRREIWETYCGGLASAHELAWANKRLDEVLPCTRTDFYE